MTNNTYEWCSKGIQPEIDFLQGVDMDIIDWWYKAFDKKENMIIQDVETIKKDHEYIVHLRRHFHKPFRLS